MAKTTQQTAAEREAQKAYERWEKIDRKAAEDVKNDTYRRLTQQGGGK